jgi:hypothetical protein
MSHKNFDLQTSWNLRFPPLEPETSSLFWLDIFVDIALTGQLYRGIRKSNIDFIEISCPPMKRQTIIISDFW